MRPVILAFLAVLLPAAAHADPLAPVNEIMDVAKRLWSDPPEAVDYFDPDRLSRLYSAAFISVYKEARKHPAFELETGETEGDPFGYDVIVNSQDGCPLEDVNITKSGEGGGVTTVTATFKLWRCSSDPAERDIPSEVRFRIVEENGRPVIDDIVRMLDGEGLSLMEEMNYIASGEPELPQDGEGEADGQGEDSPE